MEPVFMILGQSAATTAVMAIDDRIAVQDVSYAALGGRLLRDGQILEANASKDLAVTAVTGDPRTAPNVRLESDRGVQRSLTRR
jgi:hypothetical protein